MFPIVLVALIAQAVSQAAGPTDVTRLTLSQPRAICEVDTGKLKGSPSRLALSTDGSIYLRTVEVDRFLNERGHHFMVSQAAGSLAPIEAEPAWATSYWAWKQDTAAPRDPSFRIDVESRKQAMRSVSAAKGGELAGMGGAPPMGAGGEGMSAGAAADAAANAQQTTTVTLKVKGQFIGEWTNARPQPGLVFGWAPAPLGALAYVDQKKKTLVLLDREGRKRDVPGTGDVILPAWSPDGKRLAYLEKKDKKKFTLMVVDITNQ